jgi:AbrB family looped-hinge helix DNA binding protein
MCHNAIVLFIMDFLISTFAAEILFRQGSEKWQIWPYAASGSIPESMPAYTARMEKSGRILIPAALRRRLGLSAGSQVLLRIEDSGELALTSRSQALAQVRAQVRQYIPVGEDLAEELIRDRRTEAAREDPE